MNPHILPDVLARDAKMHEGLRIGFDYMERHNTVVIPRPAPRSVRGIRLSDFDVTEMSPDTPPSTVTGRECSHEVREVGARLERSVVTWQFAYCDHQHRLYTTEPREIVLES